MLNAGGGRGAAAESSGDHPVILSIGVDVVAIERISRSLAGGDGRFEKQAFTREERAACAGRADRAQVLET